MAKLTSFMNKKDKKYIQIANSLSELSDDPKTGVGSIIVKDDNIISHGVNELPLGLNKEYDKRRVENPLKGKWMLHAERNAIYKAARNGISLIGTKMYCTYFPCADCARGIIQAGIEKLYTEKPDFNHHKWGESWVEAIIMLKECGVEVIWTNEEDDE